MYLSWIGCRKPFKTIFVAKMSSVLWNLVDGVLKGKWEHQRKWFRRLGFLSLCHSTSVLWYRLLLKHWWHFTYFALDSGINTEQMLITRFLLLGIVCCIQRGQQLPLPPLPTKILEVACHLPHPTPKYLRWHYIHILCPDSPSWLQDVIQAEGSSSDWQKLVLLERDHACLG